VILNVNVQLTTRQTILTGKDNHYHSQKNYKFVSSKLHHRILVSIMFHSPGGSTKHSFEHTEGNKQGF